MPDLYIPLDQIVPPEPVLRRFSETTVEFLELVTQIKELGYCLQAPPARLLNDGRVQIADGHRRLRASIAAGVETMPLHVFPMTDEEYLSAQIACNALHDDTDWIDFAKHLDRLRLMGDHEMTLAELANVCNRRKAWVTKMLSLKNLDKRAAACVRRGEISVGNAVTLVKIQPKSEQHKYFRDARIMKVDEFAKKIRKVVNEFREGLMAGRLEMLGTDELLLQMRSLKIIEAEVKTPTHLPLIIAAQGVTEPLEAALMALKWAFRVDPETIIERKQKMLVQERQRLADAVLRKQSREERKGLT